MSYRKKLRRLERLMDQAMAHYQGLHAALGDAAFHSETGQYLLDRWAQRVNQLNEWELRKVHGRFENTNC